MLSNFEGKVPVIMLANLIQAKSSVKIAQAWIVIYFI
jgi:hypothetical protein